MDKFQPTDYFFLHHIETEQLLQDDLDLLPLSDFSYLCIGHAEWTKAHKITDNTFFSLEDARLALLKIREALAFKKEVHRNQFYYFI